MNGDKPKAANFKSFGMNRRRVPGLRDELPASTCKVYKMVDGKKTLVRVE